MSNTNWGGMRMSGNGGGGSINTSQLTQDILNGVEEIIRPSGHQYPNVNLYPKQFYLVRGTYSGTFYLSDSDNKYALEHMDISKLTNITELCKNFSYSSISLDLSGWDVSNVEVATMLFYNSSFNSLNLSGWDVRKLKSMYQMLFNCNVNTLDVSDWDVTNVTSMESMFASISNLASLDLSTWDTSYVSTFYDMLSSASSITSLLWGGAINANDDTSRYSPALDLSSTSITPANANLFFQSLGTKTSSGTTTIKMPSTAQGADLSIAEAKGYTISNITQP